MHAIILINKLLHFGNLSVTAMTKQQYIEYLIASLSPCANKYSLVALKVKQSEKKDDSSFIKGRLLAFNFWKDMNLTKITLIYISFCCRLIF